MVKQRYGNKNFNDSEIYGAEILVKTNAGVPIDTPADGALRVDTTNDALYIRSSGAWTQAGGGGGGDPYFVTDFTGTVPFLDPKANSAIMIGEGVSNDYGADNILIGRDTSAGLALGLGLLSGGNVVIGAGSNISGKDSVMIGHESYGYEGNENTFIGSFQDLGSFSSRNVFLGHGIVSLGSANDSVAIGTDLSLPSGIQRTVAIGNALTVATGNQYNVTIGDTLTNNSNRTVNIGHNNNIFASSDRSVSIGYNTDSLTSDAFAIGTECKAAGKSVAIGYKADSSGTPFDTGIVAIGNSAAAAKSDAIAIGTSSTAIGYGSVAIGTTSTAVGYGSVQIGAGINPTDNTLQFLTTSLATGYGVNVPISNGVPVANAPDGSLTYDSLNQTLYIRAFASWNPV